MKLTLRKSTVLEDWYVIERAEPAVGGSRRLSDADCEGTGAEMRSIADAIEGRNWDAHKRCAVNVRGGNVYFHSPANSERRPHPVPLADADELVTLIRQTVPGKDGV